MKRTRFILLLQLLFILPLASCEKLNDLVKGDVTCKIDGRAWTSFEDDFKLSDVDCIISNNGEQIYIVAINTKTSDDLSILITTPGKVISGGSYELSSDRYNFGSYYDPQSNKFITGNGYKGTIEIKSIDKVKMRISGSFQFIAFDAKTNKSISITDGQFDTDYTVQ